MDRVPLVKVDLSIPTLLETETEKVGAWSTLIQILELLLILLES